MADAVARFARKLIKARRRSQIQRFVDRFAKAGSADDCGHEQPGQRGGKFTHGNTCAASSAGRVHRPAAGRSQAQPASEVSPLGGKIKKTKSKSGDWAGDIADAAIKSVEKKKETVADLSMRGGNYGFRVKSPAPFQPGQPIGNRIAVSDAFKVKLPKLIDAIKTSDSSIHDIRKKLQDAYQAVGDFTLNHSREVALGILKGQDRQELNRLHDEFDDAQAKVMAAENGNIPKVISETLGVKNREMKFKNIDSIGTWEETILGVSSTGVSSQTKVNPAARRQEATDWIESLVAGAGEIPTFWDVSNLVRAQATLGTGGQPRVTMDYENKTKTYVHEMGHILEEQVEGILKAAGEFKAYRLKGEKERPMNELIPQAHGAYKENEFGSEDEFRKAFGDDAPYIGKKYDNGFTEVVSMGLEKLYTDAAGFAEKDPEYAAFIIGILDGSLRSP